MSPEQHMSHLNIYNTSTIILNRSGRVRLVFKSPVQSGFFPTWGQTETATGLIQFNIYVEPNRTPCNQFVVVLTSLETGWGQFEPQPTADQPWVGQNCLVS
jgi:hypothetical protein